MKKEVHIPKTFAIVDFSDTAKEYCAFDQINIQIKLYSQGQLIDVKWFSEKEINDLISRGIPVVYKLDTSSCQIPENRILFGRLKVGRIW